MAPIARPAAATAVLKRAVLLLLVLLLLQLHGAVEAKECSQKELRVFDEVSAQVSACVKASGLALQMPPRTSLPLASAAKLCKTPSCTHMLGAVDDLTLPRCEVLFDNRNVTLQTGVDRFAALCESASPAPAPLWKKKASSSSSSSSGSGGSRRKETSGGVRACGVGVAAALSLAAFLALAA
ncbi:hypothetical protein PybrP1_006300 [[Pythium] brassicae (nom. inval.)]|nr:hypothetical protein PybrP1_006300 [[Pythium] brassicae (nom. inval.)]